MAASAAAAAGTARGPTRALRELVQRDSLQIANDSLAAFSYWMADDWLVRWQRTPAHAWAALAVLSVLFLPYVAARRVLYGPVPEEEQAAAAAAVGPRGSHPVLRVLATTLGTLLAFLLTQHLLSMLGLALGGVGLSGGELLLLGFPVFAAKFALLALASSLAGGAASGIVPLARAMVDAGALFFSGELDARLQQLRVSAGLLILLLGLLVLLRGHIRRVVQLALRGSAGHWLMAPSAEVAPLRAAQAAQRLQSDERTERVLYVLEQVGVSLLIRLFLREYASWSGLGDTRALLLAILAHAACVTAAVGLIERSYGSDRQFLAYVLAAFSSLHSAIFFRRLQRLHLVHSVLLVGFFCAWLLATLLRDAALRWSGQREETLLAERERPLVLLQGTSGELGGQTGELGVRDGQTGKVEAGVEVAHGDGLPLAGLPALYRLGGSGLPLAIRWLSTLVRMLSYLAIHTALALVGSITTRQLSTGESALLYLVILIVFMQLAWAELGAAASAPGPR